MQSALLHQLRFTVRTDCRRFCFCCIQYAFKVRHADLDPQQMASRYRRQCCRSIPGCLVIVSVAELLHGGLSSWSSGHVRFCSTLSQFLPDLSKKFVILRRHEHGRPVSRRKSDLQGPKLGGRTPRQRLFGANLYWPSVPLELPLLQGGCQIPRLSRILRGYGGVPGKQDDRTPHKALPDR